MKDKLNLTSQKPRSKMRVAIILGLVLTLGILGGTYAYSVHQTEADNLLTAHSVSGEVIENGTSVGDDKDFTLTPGTDVPKEVAFKNTGNAPVFVRVAYAQTWMDTTGALLVHNDGYATPKWTTEWTSEWSDGGDGWYYYNKVLSAGTTTADVLSSVEFLDAPPLPDEYANGQYQLTFVMEVVQCSDDEDVNEDALTQTFGRTASVTNGNVTW